MKALVWRPPKVACLLTAWQAGGGDYLAIREQLFAEETVATLFDKVLAYQEGNDSSQK